ncbi:MAG: adenosine kinase [Pseudomonadota bacterium]|nr:adenosine kinase [Pseudomonadota bacterium]
MTTHYDVVALGNAIVDVIAQADDAFLAREALVKGSMGLIDEERAHSLYGVMGEGLETSGGSAGNTVAGVASLGGSAAYIGKVANDQLGEVFAHDMKAVGVRFDIPPLVGGAATARCLVNVTPDGERTMSTFLGASVALTAADVDPALIRAAKLVYLEGYLFDPDGGRAAFAKAAQIARDTGVRVAMTLSDAFVVHRHRAGLLAFMEEAVDVVFANEAEVGALFEGANFDAACDQLASKVKIAAVTRGAAGSVVISGGERITVAADPVAKVVDTTGAGDQYAAGFLFGLARSKSLTDCARLGHLAAGEVIGHYGPRPLTSLKALAEAKGL